MSADRRPTVADGAARYRRLHPVPTDPHTEDFTERPKTKLERGRAKRAARHGNDSARRFIVETGGWTPNANFDGDDAA